LAIGSVSKNTKVTARAGSGKTATLVLRAIFLNLHCNINWDHMLIMAFNRNAADEINNRINRYLKIINPKLDLDNPENNISVASTFHAFAEGIVKEPHKDLLLITEEKSSSDANIADKSPQDMIHGIFQTKIKSVHENLTKVKNVIFEHLTHFNDDVVDDTQAELSKKGVSDQGNRILNLHKFVDL
jgi:DNA helicase-4